MVMLAALIAVTAIVVWNLKPLTQNGDRSACSVCDAANTGWKQVVQ